MWYLDATLPSRGMIPIRLAVGWVLLSNGLELVRKGVPDALVASEAGSAVFTSWGQQLFAQYPLLGSSHLLALGALSVGLALMLGAFTRPAALVGVLLSVGLFAALRDTSDRQLLLLVGAACFGCVVTSAGLRLGLDSQLVGRLPYFLTWTRASTRARPAQTGSKRG